MRSWFRRCGWRRAHESRDTRHAGALSDCPANRRVVITGNAQLATIELGLCTGATVDVLHNDAGSHMLVVQVGDARLTIPRTLADEIYVQPFDCQNGGARPRHLLREIRSYLQQNGKVDTHTLAIHFDMQEDAMEGILMQLEQRGLVQRHSLAGCVSLCSGCKGCADASPVPTVSWSIV